MNTEELLYRLAQIELHLRHEQKLARNMEGVDLPHGFLLADDGIRCIEAVQRARLMLAPRPGAEEESRGLPSTP